VRGGGWEEVDAYREVVCGVVGECRWVARHLRVYILLYDESSVPLLYKATHHNIYHLIHIALNA